MDTAFFTELNVELGGAAARAELAGTVNSEPACGGPWSDELQHGGPPSALLVRLAEQLATTAAGRSDLVAARIAAEFLAPVPVAPLTVSARVLRLARSAVLISAELAAGGRACLQARVWLVPENHRAAGPHSGSASERAPEAAATAEDAAATAEDAAATPENRDDPLARPVFDMDGFPYARHLEWRAVSGAARRPGPASTWARARVPLVAGERLSSLQRLALVADSASGISSLVDWDDWSFANVDLDVHLTRQSQDDWVLMQAVSEYGAGLGMARSTLSDRAGVLGAGLQTLLIRSRRD
ncbi:MAG TPA: thioesterase family protein [Jatrophihabitans sp.]|uniref:thioesterase family protein n=1 Tax=Jatrophihabitans sp. TaxID=1932789 RepID=UPI002F0EEB54